jgi:hypothetical protein
MDRTAVDSIAWAREEAVPTHNPWLDLEHHQATYHKRQVAAAKDRFAASAEETKPASRRPRKRTDRPYVPVAPWGGGSTGRHHDPPRGMNAPARALVVSCLPLACPPNPNPSTNKHPTLSL